MEEIIEQTSEVMETEEDFFADDFEPTEDTTEVDEEPSEEQPQEPTVAENNVVDEFILDTVYNGENRKLNREEAIMYAQKGMNYDKIQQKLQEAQNSPEIQLIRKLAEQNGVSKDGYMDFLKNLETSMEQQALNNRVNQLMNERYLDEQSAREVARIEAENKRLTAQQKAQEDERERFRRDYEQKQLENQRKQEQFNKEIADIVKLYPDFPTKYPTIESMPQALQEAVRNGSGVMATYQSMVIAEMQNKLSAYEQNETNKHKAPGSAISKSNSNGDGFLDALFGD